MSTHVAKAGLGLMALVHGLVRGKSLDEAQADANAVVSVAAPVLDELEPHLEAMREARKERSHMRHPCTRSALCVLGANHPGPYCQDSHGTFFEENTSP